MLFLSPALLVFKSLILSMDILQTEFYSPVDNGNKIFCFKFYKVRSKPLNIVILDRHGFNGLC